MRQTQFKFPSCSGVIVIIYVNALFMITNLGISYGTS